MERRPTHTGNPGSRWPVAALIGGILAFASASEAAIVYRSTSQYQTGNYVNSFSINKPAGVIDGDVMVMTAATQDSNGSTVLDPPAGWTQVRMSYLGIGQVLYTWYKVASAEPASYTLTFPPGLFKLAVVGIVAYSGVSTSHPIDAEGGQLNGVSPNVTAPSITTTTATTWLVGGFAVDAVDPAPSYTPPFGMTERVDLAVANCCGGNWVTLELTDEPRGAVGATGTRVAVATEPNHSSIGHLLALNPAVPCCALATTEVPGSTITVTGAGQFEMRFNTATGGGIDQFYDLAESPVRDPAHDLAGGIDGIETLFTDAIESGGIGNWYDNAQKPSDAPPVGSKPKLDLLETTAARVRVRAESFYFLEWSVGVILPNIKSWTDYSVHPSGRLAYRLNRRTYAPVTYSKSTLNLGVHLAAAPLASWTGYSQMGVLGSQLPTNTFGLFTNDMAGARTDFLQIPHQNWTLAGHPAAATEWARFDSGAEEYGLVEWREFAGTTIPADTSEVWDFLTYVKPTNFASNLDPAVTSRAADYRTPSTVTVGPGTQWQDAAENTAGAGDFFNESEAAYAFNLNPATGLTLALDGSGTTRYSPFFKIREWRSFVEAPNVTFDPDGVGALPATALRRDVDYKAAVKPVSRAHFANTLTWHCTLDDTSVTNTCTGIGIDLDVGSGGGVARLGCPGPADCVDIVPARYGFGARFDNNSDYISVPAGAADFNVGGGAIEFWYQPNLGHTASGPLVFWRTNSVDDCFVFEKTGANALRFSVRSGAASNCTSGGSLTQVSVPAANYSWRGKDWVHLRTTWSSAFPGRIAISMNGVELAFNTGYNSGSVTAGAAVFIGGCSGVSCPLGSTGNADGIIDEPHLYFGPSEPGSIAHAGLVGAGDEYLADSGFNYPLNLAPVDGSRRGRYLYFGADSKFHGLNVSLATAGAGVADTDVAWQYWRGGSGAWVTLAPTDGTRSFKQTGTVSWADPSGWSPMSVSGGPDLYYVRAQLVNASAGYGAVPVERQIKTDILLFQYCGDVTTAAATFAFAVPPTTEVKLQSFTATAGDATVLVEWRTASELQNQGFHLYRGVSETGPWARLTASLIPGLGSSAVGQAYSFRDVGLTNGTRYFYRLEDVDASSKATPHGPVSAVPVTGAPGGAPGNEPPASSGGKKKSAVSASCPDWVVAAYGSMAGSFASAATLSCTRHGDPEAVSLAVVSRDSRQATLELKTGGFYALREASGGVRVFVPGFDFPQDPQAPALPFRRALVDAVVGRRAQLGGVRALDQVTFKGLVPASLGGAEMQVSRDGTVRAGRRAARESAPQHVSLDLARLLPSVFQGDAKSAVVVLTPLRYDSRRQQIVLSRRLLVKLLFTGRETGESGRGRFGRRERPEKPLTGEVLARLYTTGRGLYAVPFEQLFPDRQVGFASSQLRLERQGQAQGFHVAPASDSFGPGSVLYFHADTTASSTDFSSETAWELLRVRDGLQMPLVSATPSAVAVTTTSTGQASFETNRFYQPGLLEAPDLWLWEALGSGTTRAKSFSLNGIDAASSQAAELEVFLQGASESGNPVDHHVSVSLNGTPVGETQFAGKKPYRMSLGVPQSLLREGANELQLTNVADTGVSSFVFLDRFAVSYPQTSSLASGVFEGTWAESGTATVSGVASPVALLDVTASPVPGASSTTVASASRALWLAGYESAGSTLRFRAEAGHRYLAVSQQALLTPRVAAAALSSLRATTNQADYLLIAPRAFLAAAEPLLQRRHDQGLQTRAVAFEEIAEEFGHGQPSAEAIKGFLSFAFQSWARPSPRYVLLLGDSTYDPRNFIGTSQPSPLPALWAKTSYLWTVSDPLLAAVNGDDALPDLAIGRLPAATVEQAQVLVEKLIAWEDSGQGLSGQAALVADNPDLAGDFEADARDIAASFLVGRSQLLLLSQLGPGTRPAIQDALNAGLSLLSYVGHGGAAVWAGENVWNSWDAPSLQAQSQQPFLLTMNCLNGYFVAPAFDSLSESLLKAEGRGAIASFSPSGLSLDGPAHQYHRALMAELTSGTHERLGDAVLAAQKAYAQTGLMPELIGVYHLLGDPAMRVQ